MSTNVHFVLAMSFSLYFEMYDNISRDEEVWGWAGRYLCCCLFVFILRRMGKNKALSSHTSTYQIHVVFRFNLRSRCNRSSRCCYRAREHVDPAWSRRIGHGGDSHPEMSSSPGSVGLARAHPLTKPQAMEPFRQTWSSYGPPYPLGRWSSELLFLFFTRQ